MGSLSCINYDTDRKPKSVETVKKVLLSHYIKVSLPHYKLKKYISCRKLQVGDIGHKHTLQYCE